MPFWRYAAFVSVSGLFFSFQQRTQYTVVCAQHPADPADDGAGRTGLVHDLGVDALVGQQFGNVVALHCAELRIAAHVLQKTIAFLRGLELQKSPVQAGVAGGMIFRHDSLLFSTECPQTAALLHYISVVQTRINFNGYFVIFRELPLIRRCAPPSPQRVKASEAVTKFQVKP